MASVAGLAALATGTELCFAFADGFGFSAEVAFGFDFGFMVAFTPGD